MDALALVLDLFGITDGHWKDGNVARHAHDECGTRIDRRLHRALITTAALRKDANDLLVLEMLRRTFEAGAIGRTTLDRKRASTRDSLA